MPARLEKTPVFRRIFYLSASKNMMPSLLKSEKKNQIDIFNNGQQSPYPDTPPFDDRSLA